MLFRLGTSENMTKSVKLQAQQLRFPLHYSKPTPLDRNFWHEIIDQKLVSHAEMKTAFHWRTIYIYLKNTVLSTVPTCWMLAFYFSQEIIEKIDKKKKRKKFLERGDNVSWCTLLSKLESNWQIKNHGRFTYNGFEGLQ